MLVVKWYARGDRQLTVRRTEGYHTFSVASSNTGGRVDYAQGDRYILNPDKRYTVELKEDSFELHEDTKEGKDMACIICGNELSSADTNNICRICQRKMAEPKPVPVPTPTYYQTGWVCPKCGSVYGPMTTECSRCCPPPKVT